MKTATVALGGNSLIRPEDRGTAEEQFKRIKRTCEKLGDMISEGYELVLTHGNGPQVGNILLQNELASAEVPALPLDVCGAESQGQIGYMFQQTLGNELSRRGIDKVISSIITQVVVDKGDPAFANPTKFIGPYYSEEEAEKKKKERNWIIKETSNGKYRRVVPSPEPQRIVESDIIQDLIFAEKNDYIVIGAGGGGVPVVEEDGNLKGVEGVIDKDKATAVLASQIQESFLILLTNVERVYLNFGEENEESIQEMTAEEAERYLNEGHFPAGSMGPKIKASIDFLEKGGEKVLITAPERLLKALDGKTGTYIYSR
ncbi:MAG: carbamate kinase [Candidatus Aenigmatarchaeota archaeon]